VVGIRLLWHRVSVIDEDGSTSETLEFNFQPSGLGWLADGSLLVVAIKERKLFRRDAGELFEYAAQGEFFPGFANADRHWLWVRLRRQLRARPRESNANRAHVPSGSPSRRRPSRRRGGPVLPQWLYAAVSELPSGSIVNAVWRPASVSATISSLPSVEKARPVAGRSRCRR